jgi:hypothetical protein
MIALYKGQCDVIHCYVKCQSEIDWPVKQSKAQQILGMSVGTSALELKGEGYPITSYNS